MNKLYNHPEIEFTDKSIPLSNPLYTKSDKELAYALQEIIRTTNCLVVFGKMDYVYSRWMKYEIEMAIYYNKPIVTVIPWNQQRIPNELLALSSKVVRWNIDPIVRNIKEAIRESNPYYQRRL